jgi:hypothetical protein
MSKDKRIKDKIKALKLSLTTQKREDYIERHSIETQIATLEWVLTVLESIEWRRKWA